MTSDRDMRRTISRPGLAIPALALGWLLACGGTAKDAAEPGRGTVPEAAQPHPEAPVAAESTPVATRGAAAADEETWRQQAELIMSMFRLMAEAAAAHGDDCDGFSQAIDAIVDDHPDSVAAGTAMGQDPRFQEWVEANYRSEIEERLYPAIARMVVCKGNPSLQRALDKLEG